MNATHTILLPVQFTRLAPKRYEERSRSGLGGSWTPPDRRDSSRSGSLLRNLEKELATVDTSRRSSSSRPAEAAATSDQARRGASDVNELRYGRSSTLSPLQNFTKISLDRDDSPPSSDSPISCRTSLRALETREHLLGSRNDISSMPSRQPKKQQARASSSSHSTNSDEYEESERSSSRLSNSGSCSSSGAGLSQSLTEMHLRTSFLKPLANTDFKPATMQEARLSRSNSLNRSSEIRLQTDRGSAAGKEVAGLVGLINEGNTCYLNSCLQCLAHTVPLSSAVLGPFSDLIQSKGSSARSRRDSASLSELLACAFRQAVKDLCAKPSHSTASASLLLQALHGLAPQFGGGRQHDAQEAMRTIIDGLHEALNRKPPGRPKSLPDPPPTTPEADIADMCWEHHKTWNNSVIQDIFCGQLQSTIECSVCQRKSHCFDPFLDLSLPLPKHRSSSDGLRSYNSRSRVTIEDCLSAFVAPETLDTSNKYYCSRCKAPQISTKKLSIYRAPSILVLHIKRFYGVEPRSYKKDDRAVSYPLTGLDLSNFISATARRMLNQQTIYDLYGVCTHFGSLGYGHYTATCRSVDNGWYCYNDSSVSPVQDPIDSSAYILFYQQRT